MSGGRQAFAERSRRGKALVEHLDAASWIAQELNDDVMRHLIECALLKAREQYPQSPSKTK